MELLSFRQAAKALGIYPQTVSDIVRLHRIVTKPLPKRGKGLDAADLAKIRRVLTPRPAR